MLIILSRIRDQDIPIVIKSPPEQYSISKTRIREITDEIKPLK